MLRDMVHYFKLGISYSIPMYETLVTGEAASCRHIWNLPVLQACIFLTKNTFEYRVLEINEIFFSNLYRDSSQIADKSNLTVHILRSQTRNFKVSVLGYKTQNSNQFPVFRFDIVRLYISSSYQQLELICWGSKNSDTLVGTPHPPPTPWIPLPPPVEKSGNVRVPIFSGKCPNVSWFSYATEIL